MDYDVCLSFVGEDRDYVKAVAEALRRRAVRVCYDEYEQAELWGKDLYSHLDEVYRAAARYCVVFISLIWGRRQASTTAGDGADLLVSVPSRTCYL